MAALMLPSAVLTHLKAGVLAAFANREPVLMAAWVHPASTTAEKQASPSETTSAPERERRAGEFADREFTERLHPPQDNLIRLAILCRGDGGDERRLARSAAPPSAGALAADIGVVHLDLAFQFLALIAFEHDLRELVFHHPGRGLSDAEPA